MQSMDQAPRADRPTGGAAAEAARYALLQRLAPSMRHHLVVHLQPIGMIHEVMHRRLRATAPDLPAIQDNAHKINAFARAALVSCNDVVGWIAPDGDARASVQEAARECAGLLATSFSFRGHVLRNEVEEVPGEVRRCAVRQLLAAALIHAADHRPPPTQLTLRARPHVRGVEVSLLSEATKGSEGFPGEAGYRRLAWEDLQAIAVDEGVEVHRAGDALSMIFPVLETPRTVSAG